MDKQLSLFTTVRGIKMELTTEQMQRVAPSIFQTNKWHERTSKYKFVPTVKVMNALQDCGYNPVDVQQSKSRIQGKSEFTKHLIKFRNNSLINLDNKEVTPEIILINSHDGSSSFKLMLGIFRFACANGLIVSEANFGSISVRHMGESNLCRDIIKASNSLIKQSPKILNRINDWQGITLDVNAQIDYAKQSKAIIKSTIDVEPERLIRPRRYSDQGETLNLWKVYNNVQENIIKGGLYGRNEQGYFRHSRAVKSIDNNVRINRELWQLTDKFAKGLKYIEPISDYAKAKTLIAKYGSDWINHTNEL